MNEDTLELVAPVTDVPTFATFGELMDWHSDPRNGTTIEHEGCLLANPDNGLTPTGPTKLPNDRYGTLPMGVKGLHRAHRMFAFANDPTFGPELRAKPVAAAIREINVLGVPGTTEYLGARHLCQGSALEGYEALGNKLCVRHVKVGTALANALDGADPWVDRVARARAGIAKNTLKRQRNKSLLGLLERHLAGDDEAGDRMRAQFAAQDAITLARRIQADAQRLHETTGQLPGVARS